MQDKLFIGIDVAKHWIDIAIHGGPSRRIDNTRQAIQAWLGTLDHTSIALVAFEPTGGYERALRQCLREAGVPFARVHPNEAAAFRTRRGVKAKTDRLDAGLLADFAALEFRGPRPRVARRRQRGAARDGGSPPPAQRLVRPGPDAHNAASVLRARARRSLRKEQTGQLCLDPSDAELNVEFTDPLLTELLL